MHCSCGGPVWFTGPTSACLQPPEALVSEITDATKLCRFLCSHVHSHTYSHRDNCMTRNGIKNFTRYNSAKILPDFTEFFADCPPQL